MRDKPRHDVLIVSADRDAVRAVLEVLAGRGVHGTVLRDGKAALDRLSRDRCDLIVIDGQFESDDAARVLSEAVRSRPETPAVAVTPPADVNAAVGAMRLGARDVLPKPLRRAAIEALLDGLLPSNAVAIAAACDETGGDGFRIAGKSRALTETIAAARRVATTSAPVLITGDSGTGKELLSHLIHHHSRRRRAPYVTVNCAALNESLLESELFGHEKGAFTGAHARHKGRFERADGGTLLLDEISETGPRLQAELLRVLEQQDFERLGGSDKVRVDGRLISTSNRDLAEDARSGRFRRDLYYRLRGVHIRVPPLRERPEDLPPLVWHFVNAHAAETGRRIERLDEEMMRLFAGYAWPGNVRQLRNVVRSALILGEGPVLSLEGVPALRAELTECSRCDPDTLSLAELERRAILEALRRTRSHQGRAADLLGITDRTLRDKLKRYREDGTLPERIDKAGQSQMGEREWAPSLT